MSSIKKAEKATETALPAVGEPPPPVDPTFNAAKRLYAEQFGDAIVTNTYLKIAIAALSVLLLAVTATQWRTMRALSDFKPLVVRIDQVGRAEAIRYDGFNYSPKEPEIKYFLGEFCRLYYSRNRSALADNFRRSLAFMSPQLADQILTAWNHAKVIEEYSRGNMGDIDIEVIGVSIQDLREPPYQARVDFHQVLYASRERTVSNRALYAANISFNFAQGTLPTSVLAVNPLGLTIEYFKEDLVQKSVLPDPTKALQ